MNAEEENEVREFQVPNAPEELEAGEEPVARDLLAEEDDDKETALKGMVEGLVFELCEQEALCIVEDDAIFDQLYTLTKYFPSIGGTARVRLLESLCSNLSVLVASTGRMLAVDESQRRQATVSHRSALKAYVFFLHWIWSQADREHREASAKAEGNGANSGVGGRGRRRQINHRTIDWDWDTCRLQICSAVASVVVRLDLWALFRPVNPPEALLLRFSHLGQWALREPLLTKDPKSREAAFHLLCSSALKYGQLECMTAPLVNLLSDHEHLPAVFADMAAFAANTYQDTQLAAALLQEIVQVDPVSYKEQQSNDSKGLKSSATFLEKLAEALPQVVVQHAALLAPHLGGEAYTLRSAIVTMFGHCINGAFEVNTLEDDRHRDARVKSKQSLLDTLLERTRDQNAFTRARTLHTWGFLATERAIPLSMWTLVAKIAKGRLNDKASVVRKAAMQLLQTMLQFNMFGPTLAVGRFQESLAVAEVKLAEQQQQEQQATEQAGDGEAETAGEVSTREGVDEGDEHAEPKSPGDNEFADATSNDGDGEVDTPKQQSQSPKQTVPSSPASDRNYEISAADLEGGEASMPYLVATLKVAVSFIRTLMQTVPTLEQLLASGTITDINEAINLITVLYSFRVDGSPAALRSMLPLVFSREEAVRKAVVDATALVFLAGQEPQESAASLMALVTGSSVGDLAALEEVVGLLVTDSAQLDNTVVSELWRVARSGSTVVGEVSSSSAGWARSAMVLLSMVARHRPATVTANLNALLDVAFPSTGAGASSPDALLTRHAAICLKHAGPYIQNTPSALSDTQLQRLMTALTGAVVASPLPESQWYSAAEAVLSAIYAIHPEPDTVASALIQTLAHLAAPVNDGVIGSGPAVSDAGSAPGAEEPEVSSATGNDGTSAEDDDAEPHMSRPRSDAGVSFASAVALSRLTFFIGQSAMEQLIYMESLTSKIRRQVAADAKAALEAAQSQSQGAIDGESQDIGAELGVGASSASADAELDLLKEAAEREVVSASQLVGHYVPLVAAVCHSKRAMEAHPMLRSSAVLALAKLMIVDEGTCEANLPLIFSILNNRSIDGPIRSNLVIACGDLFVRFPNSLEPWTGHLYQVLTDPELRVRRNAVMVITHLILNDMMKVKGHIASMAVCLQDEDEGVCDLARLFFHELAGKSFKNTNPVFSLLPDFLSSLSSNPEVSTPKFRSIMKHLLSLVSKDKHMDALVEKMCHRLSATTEPARWRDIAFCMSQLNFTDKGLRTLVDSFKLYKHALHEAEVADTIKTILANARKGAEKEGVKEAVAEFETMFAAYSDERREEEEAARKAAEHVAACETRDSDGSSEADEESGHVDEAAGSSSPTISRYAEEEEGVVVPVGQEITVAVKTEPLSPEAAPVGAVVKVKAEGGGGEAVSVKRERGSRAKKGTVLHDATNVA